MCLCVYVNKYAYFIQPSSKIRSVVVFLIFQNYIMIIMTFIWNIVYV